jgi:tetratricopeptide (TPR) repeat protein
VETARKTADTMKKKELLTQAIQFLTNATNIHPGYTDAWRLLGNAQYELDHNIPKTFHYYCTAIRHNPGDEVSYSNVHFILSNYDSVDQKINMYRELLKINPLRADINYKLGFLYGKEKNDIPTAITYLKQAVNLKPTYKEACKDLGVAFGIDGNYRESMYWLETASTLDSLDAEVYINMGITAMRMGDKKNADIFFAKANHLKNNNVPIK